jgi:hypothetical protein
MAIRATVLPDLEPGFATLRISELDTAPEGLSISIQRQQGPESHLADDGWRRTEAWLVPDEVTKNGDALDFHLGPEICDRLAGIATVRLRVREPDIGLVGQTVIAWPTMLTSGALGPNGALDDTVRLRRRRRAEPVLATPAAVITPMPDLRAEREQEPEPAPPPPPKRGHAGTWTLTALLLLLVAGGAYYWQFMMPKEPAPVAAAPPPPAPPPPVEAAIPAKSIREVVAEYVATKPAPEAMLTKGREFAQTGNMNGAFLVWRHAAEAGNAPAQVEVAAFYDPVTPQPKGAFTADGARAADWYERAALAGLPDAQRRLGLLFAKGGAGLNADPAKARNWLQQAAAQNDEAARKALETLPK